MGDFDRLVTRDRRFGTIPSLPQTFVTEFTPALAVCVVAAVVCIIRSRASCWEGNLAGACITRSTTNLYGYASKCAHFHATFSKPQVISNERLSFHRCQPHQQQFGRLRYCAVHNCFFFIAMYGRMRTLATAVKGVCTGGASGLSGPPPVVNTTSAWVRKYVCKRVHLSTVSVLLPAGGS